MKFEVWYLAHGIPEQYLLPRLEHFGQSQWYHQSSCSCVFHLPALEKMGARPDRMELSWLLSEGHYICHTKAFSLLVSLSNRVSEEDAKWVGPASVFLCVALCSV